MTAAACLKKAFASGIELYVEAGRLRGQGPKPGPEFAAALREHEAEIVALLAEGPETVPKAVPPDASAHSRYSAVDNAAEYHQRRIAAKEAELAGQGLGPDGATPLAEYQRLAAEGEKLIAQYEGTGKILGSIHTRIPMVSVDEQRTLQRENAEADERFWTALTAFCLEPAAMPGACSLISFGMLTTVRE
jgi:hypothetical protein